MASTTELSSSEKDSLITASKNPDPSVLLDLAKSAAREANLPALNFCLHDLSVAPTSLIIPALASTDAPAAVSALLKAGLDPSTCIPSSIFLFFSLALQNGSGAAGGHPIPSQKADPSPPPPPKRIDMVEFMRSEFPDREDMADPPSPDYRVPGHQGTPLCLAAVHAKLPLIRHLLACGADPNLTNVGYGGDSLRPLACCAAGWQLDGDAAAAMRVLMDEGGAGWQGSGALQISAKKGREECVKVLVERGADVEESVGKLEEGKKALVLAREGGHGGVVEILRGKGARD